MKCSITENSRIDPPIIGYIQRSRVHVSVIEVLKAPLKLIKVLSKKQPDESHAPSGRVKAD